MKKLISILITATMLISMVACNTKETTETTATTETTTVATTSQTTETTVAVTTEPAVINPDGLEITLDKVSKEVLYTMGEGFTFQRFDYKTNMNENKKLGVLDYRIIINDDSALSKKVGDFDIFTIKMLIAEFDMSSDVYKNLDIGKDFFVFEGSSRNRYKVTAISKQYVVSISAAYGTGTGYKSEDFEDSAPFTVENAQEGLEAFMKSTFDYKEAYENTTIDDITYYLLKVLGDQYEISNSPLEFNSVENNKLGITDYREIVNSRFTLSKKIDGFDTYSVKFRVFEFDPESENFKALALGDKLFYFNGKAKMSCKINAIKDRFAISVEDALGNNGGISSENYEYTPPYIISNVQAAYDAFTEFEPSLKVPQEGIQKRMPEIFSDIYKDSNCTYISISNADDTKKNLKNGITDSFIMSVVEGETIEEYNTTTFYILEFDMNSEQYKKLKEGNRVTFYNNNEKLMPDILAINNQYVLIEFVNYYKDGKMTDFTADPPYTSKTAQKIYDYFTGLK